MDKLDQIITESIRKVIKENTVAAPDGQLFMFGDEDAEQAMKADAIKAKKAAKAAKRKEADARNRQKRAAEAAAARNRMDNVVQHARSSMIFGDDMFADMSKEDSEKEIQNFADTRRSDGSIKRTKKK